MKSLKRLKVNVTHVSSRKYLFNWHHAAFGAPNTLQTPCNTLKTPINTPYILKAKKFAETPFQSKKNCGKSA